MTVRANSRKLDWIALFASRLAPGRWAGQRWIATGQPQEAELQRYFTPGKLKGSGMECIGSRRANSRMLGKRLLLCIALAPVSGAGQC